MPTHEEMFHNNVYVLSQLVPTSKDFDALFKKDMFRKQNTPGFMHVVRFLINIYDPNLKKKLMPWPCMCKQDEANYRKKCVEILEIIGKQNPDLPFPSGIPSCLFQATGSKFMIIMKMLSIIVLRQYLRVNVPGEKEIIPDFSPDLNEGRVQVMTLVGIGKAEKITNDFEDYLKSYAEVKEEKRREIRRLGEEISRNIKYLSRLIETVTVSEEDKKKLKDYMHNEDVVEAWHQNVMDSMNFIKKSICVFGLLNDLMGEIFTMINLINKPFVLDGNTLPKVDVEKIVGMLSPAYEIVARRMYEDGNLVLLNYLEIFNQITSPMVEWVQRTDFMNFEKLSLQLEASHEDAQSIVIFLQQEQERCKMLFSKMQPREPENFSHCMDEHFAIQCFSPLGRMTDYQKKEHEKQINITPVQQYSSRFFTKHKTQSIESRSSETPKDNKIRRVNVNDLLPTLTSFSALSTTQRRKKAKNLNSTSDMYQRYSGLFVSNKGANLSAMSISALPNANSTAVMNTICEEPIESIRPFEHNTPKRLNYLQVPGTLGSSSGMAKNVIKSVNDDDLFETQHGQQFSNDASVVSSSNNVRAEPEPDLQSSASTSQAPQQSHGRRSISDLLERYKSMFHKK